MGKHPVEQFYEMRRAEAAATQDPREADYLALSQGEYGTRLRHSAVLDVVKNLDCHVIDLGCGTGLILDAMVERGVKPLLYQGYDGMADLATHVLARLSKHRVEGEFHLKPMETRFEDLSYSLVDAALLVGVMGFHGYHTLLQARSIYQKMERTAQHGAITFPMIYDNEMGGPGYRRFDIDEVQSALHLPEKNIVKLEREFVIYW